jgi:hypothetical protein
MQPLGEVEALGNILFVSYRGKIVFGDELNILSRSVREHYPDFRDIIVNLQQVELRPGDIPGLLVQYLTAYAAGYRIRLCSASQAVREVLESTRVVEVFQLPLDESREQSVAAFQCSYSAPRHSRARAAAF